MSLERSWMRRSRIGLRRLAAAVLAVGGLVAPVPPTAAQDAAVASGAQDAVVYRIPVTGVIDLGLAPFIERSLREAAEAGAAAVVLDIETPGGRVDAAQRIVNAVRNAEVPVYAYVNQRALSAGAMIALATDGVYMRPGSVLGAATPVTGEGQKAPEKIVSAMRAEMRALAEQHELDPRVAEAMVDEEIAIDGVIDRGKLLTLTTEQAVAIGYAQSVDGWDALMERVGVPGAAQRTAEANWAEMVVRGLTHPLVAPFLLSIGFLGLLIELKTPAFGVAGAVGALSLAAFFGSHLIVGLAGWEEVILLAAGVALLGVEIFIVPGFGFFGIAGIVGVLASVYLSLVGHLATGADYAEAAVALSATILFVLVCAWILVRRLPTNRRLLRSGVLLGEVEERETGYVSAVARAELIGAEGVALTDLRPAGVAEVHDERVDVVAEGGWIEAGTPIRILHSEGYRVVVRPVRPLDGRPDGGADTTPLPAEPSEAAATDTGGDQPRAGQAPTQDAGAPAEGSATAAEKRESTDGA